MNFTKHSADAETFASVLVSFSARSIPAAGMIKSWIGEIVSDDGKIARVFVRSTGVEVNGLVSWTETIA